METANKTKITVGNTVNAPIEKVWDMFNKPEHITQWCAASDDWHAPHAENDLRVGGKSKTRMEAKDGSFGFDFESTYDAIKEHESIDYTIADGRKVSLQFQPVAGGVKITETFEAEGINPAEMQQAGWQAILDNFKKYVEAN